MINEPSTPNKSILTCTFEELAKIVETNTLPEGISLEGIETHKDFHRLFAHRTNPGLCAKILLKELTPFQSVENDPLREKRLDLKIQELALKKEKVKTQTWQYTQIWNTLSRLEKKIDILVSQALNNNLTKEEVKN